MEMLYSNQGSKPRKRKTRGRESESNIREREPPAIDKILNGFECIERFTKLGKSVFKLVKSTHTHTHI